MDVIIIGAGPYGLSLATYLRGCDVPFRIFGSPMQTWISQMPKGMYLKSDGFASTLYDPLSTFTLAEFCKRSGIVYSDVGVPVRLETFIAYGKAFQKKLVPELENKTVVRLNRSGSRFGVELDTGEVVTAEKVIVAAGVSHFKYVPSCLSYVSHELVTHTSQHSSLAEFKDRRVIVVGAGASALDIAGLLYEAGASVELVVRKPAIHFHNPPATMPRPWLDRVRAPSSGLGPGWRSLLCTQAPLVFHEMPERFRLAVVRRHLGPAAGWFMKDKIIGKVGLNLGLAVETVAAQGDHVVLRVRNSAGEARSLEADHIIAGTGYRVDLRRLPFLDAELCKRIRAAEFAPILSSVFESSVKGLYFVGASAAPAFGPLLRFAYGARFTAERLAKHLVHSASSKRTSRISVPRFDAGHV